MTWLRRFLARWRKPEQQLLEEFVQRLMEAQQPCDCPICQPAMLNLGHIAVLNPSRELLEEVIRWQGAVDRTPVERMQDMPGRCQ